MRREHNALRGLPPEVANLEGEPLYYIIAQWGLHLDRSFSNKEVQDAFHLTAQQVSDALRYIGLQMKGQITCTQQTVRNKFGREAVRSWHLRPARGPAANVGPARSGRPLHPGDAEMLRVIRIQLSGSDE